MTGLTLPTTPDILQKNCVELSIIDAAYAVTAGVGAKIEITIGSAVNTVAIGDILTINGIVFTFAASNDYANYEIGINPNYLNIALNIYGAVLYFYPTILVSSDNPLRKLTFTFPCGFGDVSASFTELPPITTPAPMVVATTTEQSSIEYDSNISLNIYTNTEKSGFQNCQPLNSINLSIPAPECLCNSEITDPAIAVSFTKNISIYAKPLLYTPIPQTTLNPLLPTIEQRIPMIRWVKVTGVESNSLSSYFGQNAKTTDTVAVYNGNLTPENIAFDGINSYENYYGNPINNRWFNILPDYSICPDQLFYLYAALPSLLPTTINIVVFDGASYIPIPIPLPFVGNSSPFYMWEFGVGLPQLEGFLTANGINIDDVVSYQVNILGAGFEILQYQFLVSRNCCCGLDLNFLFISSNGTFESIKAKSVGIVEYQAIQTVFNSCSPCNIATGNKNTISRTTTDRFTALLPSINNLQTNGYAVAPYIQNGNDGNVFLREFLSSKEIYLTRKLNSIAAAGLGTDYLLYRILLSPDAYTLQNKKTNAQIQFSIKG